MRSLLYVPCRGCQVFRSASLRNLTMAGSRWSKKRLAPVSSCLIASMSSAKSRKRLRTADGSGTGPGNQVTRDYDANRNLMIVRRISCVESATAVIESYFAANIPAQLGCQRFSIEIHRHASAGWLRFSFLNRFAHMLLYDLTSKRASASSSNF